MQPSGAKLPDTICGGAILDRIKARTSTVLPQPCMHRRLIGHDQEIGIRIHVFLEGASFLFADLR